MYYGITDFIFWFWLIAFFPIIFISFFVPGWIISSHLSIKNPILKFAVANAIGIVMWGFQGYLLGYLNFRAGTYLYCFASIVLFLINRKTITGELRNIIPSFSVKNLMLAALITVGSICQLLAIFPSGLVVDGGIKLFGNNSHDGVMHLAYVQSITRNFPPQEPGFSGTLIHNYHYWTDLVLSDLVRVWHLPPMHLFFQFTPIYLSIVIGLAGYLLVREWGGSRKMAYWFLFLMYFGADAAYLVLAILQKPLGFYTPAIDSGVLQFLNMPHAMGKFVFLVTLIAFHRWVTKKDFRWGSTTFLLVASLFGFKIYFGIFAVLGLGSYFIGKFIVTSFKEKRISIDYKFLGLLVGCFLISLGIFLPHNYGAGGFVYVYLEWPRSLLGAGSIDWQDWWLRRQVYEVSKNFRNLVILDLLAVVIAFVSIYGTRLLGFLITKGLLKFLGYEKVLMLVPPLIIFHLLGLFTIQSSGGVNVYNFFSVSSLPLSLFAAYTLSKLRANIAGFLLIGLFILLTLPRSMYEVYEGIRKPLSNDYWLISNDEIESLKYIKTHSSRNELVQASPANPLDRETPYVSFFTERSSYIAGAGLLATHNVKLDARKEGLEEIFKSNDIVDFTTKIKQKNIDFIYLQKNPEQRLNFKIDSAYLKTVFETNTTIVLKLL